VQASLMRRQVGDQPVSAFLIHHKGNHEDTKAR
jgi:hypothetical protein